MTAKPPDSGPRWRSRGYIPHFDASQLPQHVTFRLADSLPSALLVTLETELANRPRERQDAERRKRLEACVDAGHGSCLLRRAHNASLVQDALLHFDDVRYRLLAWVVMPNHVHALFEPQGWTVARIVASWKSYTGRRLCAPAQVGRVWQREYWDRFVRDDEHFVAVRDYIHRNPVRAGLVARPERWQWSSAAREETRSEGGSGREE